VDEAFACILAFATAPDRLPEDVNFDKIALRL
jgi:hypothetical protein